MVIYSVVLDVTRDVYSKQFYELCFRRSYFLILDYTGKLSHADMKTYYLMLWYLERNRPGEQIK